MSLRVVLLKRTASLHKDCYKETLQLAGQQLTPWVTMGHFDSIYSYQLDSSGNNIFSTIRDNNNQVAAMNDSNRYFHPLYLLTQEDDSDFWKEKFWYLAVVRIHLESTVNDGKIYERLGGRIKNACKKKHCRSFVYQTIELSDIILAVKSNRLSDMLDIVLNLWSYPSIGKLYTYCGMDFSLLKATAVEPAKKDKIGFLSMRFAVRSPGNADQFFNIITESLGQATPFSVAGVDDVILNWQELPADKLVAFYRRWFVEGFPPEIEPSTTFSDITTRLGAQYTSPPCRRRCPPPLDSSPLNQICIRLTKFNLRVQKLAQERLDSSNHRYWLRCLSEQTFSLLRLSRTALLDEFVYLMLPGVESFLVNMEHILSQPGSDSIKGIDPVGCAEFVESWSQLMEHVMRIEGQLAHQPETRPVIYDIPMAMLEHILAFLRLCSGILQRNDDHQKDIKFILVPRLCQEIKAMELFSAESDLPGLVLISIPLHMMYDPLAVQIALCHEISHFVGEKHRNREYRTDCYVSAVATLIASVIFKTENQAARNCLERNLKERIQESRCETIFEFQECINDWIADLLNPYNVAERYSRFLREVVLENKSSKSGKDTHFPIISNFDELILRYELDFQPLLWDLTMLFRETFADICMLSLMRLDAVSYINSFLPDFSGDTPKPYEAYAIRIYAALWAVEKHIPPIVAFQDNCEVQKLLISIATVQHRKSNSFNPEEEYRIPAAAVKSLLDYTKKCGEDIKNLIIADAELETLYTMYTNVSSPNMDCAVLQKHINEYRRNYLANNQEAYNESC